MKRIYLTLLTLLTCGAAYALPVGNPADPSLLTDGLFWDSCCESEYDPCDPCWFSWDMFSIRAGYYGDFVFAHRVKSRTGTVIDRGRPSDRFHSFTNAGLIILNLWDRLDLYTALGGTSFELNVDANAFSTAFIPANPRLNVETNDDFSWTVGAKATLWEWGCTWLGIDGKYFQSRPELRRVTLGGLDTVYNNSRVRYREWQVALGIAHRICFMVPYFSVEYSNARFCFRNNSFLAPILPTFANSPRFRNRQHWGYAFGVTLIDAELMSVTVEGRLQNEKAVHVNAQIRF